MSSEVVPLIVNASNSIVPDKHYLVECETNKVIHGPCDSEQLCHDHCTNVLGSTCTLPKSKHKIYLGKDIPIQENKSNDSAITPTPEIVDNKGIPPVQSNNNETAGTVVTPPIGSTEPTTPAIPDTSKTDLNDQANKVENTAIPLNASSNSTQMKDSTNPDNRDASNIEKASPEAGPIKDLKTPEEDPAALNNFSANTNNEIDRNNKKREQQMMRYRKFLESQVGRTII
jgi:hypothetical protein